MAIKGKGTPSCVVSCQPCNPLGWQGKWKCFFRSRKKIPSLMEVRASLSAPCSTGLGTRNGMVCLQGRILKRSVVSVHVQGTHVSIYTQNTLFVPATGLLMIRRTGNQQMWSLGKCLLIKQFQGNEDSWQDQN